MKITWTKTDEAPLLASYSLVPIVRAFLKTAGIELEIKDISLAGRILGEFGGKPKDLDWLGQEVMRESANIIKLPNISASVPQLKAAIAELQKKGFSVPDFPDAPASEEEKEIAARYKKILGSAVNPVLRMGNSDRRAPSPVKNYAKAHPHSMGEWQKGSRSGVFTMNGGDFRANEQSALIQNDGTLTITAHYENGTSEVLGKKAVKKDSIADATFMSMSALEEFLEAAVQEASKRDALFSLHLKATMMKASDPVIFGAAVRVFYKNVIAKHAKTLLDLGVNFNNGLGDLYAKASVEEFSQILADFENEPKNRARVAMVNATKTNFHVPSDVIIDASMPAAIRAGGKQWDKDGAPHDALFVIPDSTYAPLYDETIKYCQETGALNPATMGSVSNVGLMAQKAEEYGSHPTTFVLKAPARVVVTNEAGDEIFSSRQTQAGDIYRMCFVTDTAVKDWVALAVRRARASQTKAVFWLDDDRAHTRVLKERVLMYLKEQDLSGVDLEILGTAQAARLSIERARAGLDTISVTGNVLRDYNTDLYPILEVGTSAKMLSIVPLIAGGGLYETGAGGSAPRLVTQLLDENHLRWDSLGEFLALAPSLEQASTAGNSKAGVLAKCLDLATQDLLNADKAPKKNAGELDNRGSHFYLALYWAKHLAAQTQDADLRGVFAGVFEKLAANEGQIVGELNAVQGKAVDLGGYYLPDDALAAAVMRPSGTFNTIINNL
ncbi:MAG: NADP-dependent isocitrate dehydrogenase [Helicobacteraceae bacterium]